MTAVVETFNRLAGAWAGLAWSVTGQSMLMVGVFALVALGMRRSANAQARCKVDGWGSCRLAGTPG
jgi:hypothetical protein